MCWEDDTERGINPWTSRQQGLKNNSLCMTWKSCMEKPQTCHHNKSLQHSGWLQHPSYEWEQKWFNTKVVLDIRKKKMYIRWGANLSCIKLCGQLEIFLIREEAQEILINEALWRLGFPSGRPDATFHYIIPYKQKCNADLDQKDCCG